MKWTLFSAIPVLGLLLSAAGCQSDPAPSAEAASIETVSGLTFNRIKGTIEGTNDDGLYMHLIMSLEAGEIDAELGGYASDGAQTWLVDTTVTPETLVYDYERIYLYLVGDDCEIELDARYIPPDERDDLSDLYYMEGTMIVHYATIDETWPVGDGLEDAAWYIEFPEGAVPAPSY